MWEIRENKINNEKHEIRETEGFQVCVWEEMMNKKILCDGPDISEHNGIVNMKKVRDAGARMIGLRAGYGKGNVDQRYMANAEACYNLGIDPVLYWKSYAYSENMAQSEGKEAVKQAAKFWKKCPIAFAFEHDSVNYARKNGVEISKDMETGLAIAFLKEIQEAGYIPVLYTNKDYIKRYFYTRDIAGELGVLYIWYARSTSQLNREEAGLADMWQYTSLESWPGIAGNVNINHFYYDFRSERNESKIEFDAGQTGRI